MRFEEQYKKGNEEQTLQEEQITKLADEMTDAAMQQTIPDMGTVESTPTESAEMRRRRILNRAGTFAAVAAAVALVAVFALPQLQKQNPTTPGTESSSESGSAQTCLTGTREAMTYVDDTQLTTNTVVTPMLDTCGLLEWDAQTGTCKLSDTYFSSIPDYVTLCGESNPQEEPFTGTLTPTVVAALDEYLTAIDLYMQNNPDTANDTGYVVDDETGPLAKLAATVGDNFDLFYQLATTTQDGVGANGGTDVSRAAGYKVAAQAAITYYFGMRAPYYGNATIWRYEMGQRYAQAAYAVRLLRNDDVLSKPQLDALTEVYGALVYKPLWNFSQLSLAGTDEAALQKMANEAESFADDFPPGFAPDTMIDGEGVMIQVRRDDKNAALNDAFLQAQPGAQQASAQEREAISTYLHEIMFYAGTELPAGANLDAVLSGDTETLIWLLQQADGAIRRENSRLVDAGQEILFEGGSLDWLGNVLRKTVSQTVQLPENTDYASLTEHCYFLAFDENTQNLHIGPGDCSCMSELFYVVDSAQLFDGKYYVQTTKYISYAGALYDPTSYNVENRGQQLGSVVWTDNGKKCTTQMTGTSTVHEGFVLEKNADSELGYFLLGKCDLP